MPAPDNFGFAFDNSYARDLQGFYAEGQEPPHLSQRLCGSTAPWLLNWAWMVQH